jgi:hypothetical protein
MTQAAEFELLSKEDGTNPAIITIQGRLDQGDDMKFQNTIADVRSAVVFLESPGGTVGAGMAIGLIVKSKGFDTAVADGATCASACALAWLGGNSRRMGEGARIGFHAARNPESREASAPDNALVGSYLAKLGFPDRAIVYATKADPQSITWLTWDDSVQYGINATRLEKAEADRYLAASAECQKIQARLVEVGRLIQQSEAQLNLIDSRLGELEVQENLLRQKLEARHGSISELLAVMQRMGRNPPPVLGTPREDALPEVRNAMLLASAFPQLRGEAAAIADQLSDLLRVKDGIRIEGERLRAETPRLAQARTRLTECPISNQ